MRVLGGRMAGRTVICYPTRRNWILQCVVDLAIDQMTESFVVFKSAKGFVKWRYRRKGLLWYSVWGDELKIGKITISEIDECTVR